MKSRYDELKGKFGDKEKAENILKNV